MLYGAEQGADQDTWVVRLSAADLDVYTVAQVAADALDQGADLQQGYGVWEGEVEPSVTITLQSDENQVEYLLWTLAARFPDVRFVHVERGYAATQYVDLDDRRFAPATAVA